MTFAENLRIARKSKNMTQEELAKALTARGLNTHRQTVNTWERGKHEPPAFTLKVLADILEVTIDALLGTKIEVEDSSDGNLMLSRFVERLKERDDKDLVHAVVIGCQESARLEKLYQLAEVDTAHLDLFVMLAGLKPEKIKTLTALAQLDDAKLKALCVLSGINLGDK